MNASELKYQIESRGQGGNFFDRRTMRFFGDTMHNFGVRSATIRASSEVVDPDTGKHAEETIEVWELYRRRAVKCGNGSSFYFRKDTFRRAFALT